MMQMIPPCANAARVILAGCSAFLLIGCTNNIDAYTNPPPQPPYGTEPTMSIGATAPLAPPPAADGTF